MTHARHLFLQSIAALSLLTLATEAMAQPPPPQRAPFADSEQPSDAQAEARSHFEKGRDLLLSGAWPEALAELLQSRRLYPTWSATSSAAVCFEKLKRFDEALDLFEVLLRDYGSILPTDTKMAAQQRVLMLRQRVGTIEIDGARPGAALLVDGRARGEYPSPAPLRAGAGSHIVRVYLEGFAPFEETVEVTAGQTAHIKVLLRPLLQAGRLQVVEQSGKVLDVVVDSISVGVTPWEGPIAVGKHVVMLRGEESFGTLPVPVSIQLNQRAELKLTAEDLAASLRVVPVPATASVELDGLFVGRGIWEGRLRPGAHQIRAVADGFHPKLLNLKLERGEHNTVAVQLERNPSAPIWRLPSRFTFELSASLAITSSFGGDIVGKCSSPCERSAGVGGAVIFHAGHELWNGFGYGVTAGYLRIGQTTTGRVTSIQTVGHTEPDQGVADDTIKVRGFLAGAFAALKQGERFPFRFRLGTGALIGSVSDARTGLFRLIDPTMTKPYSVGPVIEEPSTAWFYVAPEVQAGLRLGDHLEISMGSELLLLVSAKPARWDATHPINAASDGYGSFTESALTSSLMAILLPRISARYDF